MTAIRDSHKHTTEQKKRNAKEYLLNDLYRVWELVKGWLIISNSGCACKEWEMMRKHGKASGVLVMFFILI